MAGFFINIKRGLANIANFKGRDARKQFWPYIGTAVLFYMVSFGIILAKFGATHRENAMSGAYLDNSDGGPVTTPSSLFSEIATYNSILCVIIVVLIAAAVVRRLHDTGKPGYWGLLPVPFLAIGIVMMPFLVARTEGPGPSFFLMFINNMIYIAMLVILVIMLAKKGMDGANKYGEDPLKEDFWKG